jgi:alpha-glucosidase
MIKALDEAGIKCLVDIVPNHCSEDHHWFQEALKASKGSPERERFIFRDGTFNSLPAKLKYRNW